MDGWVKVHRKILDNPIVCKDSETLSIWLYLLLNATHKEMPALFKGKKIILEEGQLITGILSISKKLKIDKSKIQRTLKCFEDDKQIEQQTSNQNRLISILNWNLYQEIDKQNDKQMINKRETDDKQLITNKNEKNDKNERIKENKKEKIHFAEFVSMTNAEYEKLVGTYGKDFADQCITVLDNYKGSSGKKYASDYRAILNWVINRVKEEQNKGSNPKNKTKFETREYTDLSFLYANKEML